MKYKKSIFAATIISAILLSYGNNASQDAKSNSEVVPQEEHHHETATDAIALNNGQKWVVNNEMKPFVAKGQELVSSFAKHNETNYTQLAKELEAQNSQLIKSCTMKGKSHDELHKWLHPHLELVKQLEKTKDTTEALQLVASLEKSYLEYENYFK